ncbi:MAG: pyridoxamine 5'-phosphate oxidase family protein, partial [Anaerolineae bacterium]|nr:pyridoxamine 5'-phosphate oxidase family protein [Anaerolineae bacterium]
DREIEDRVAVESILREATVCRVALSVNDIPYVVPLNFGYEDGCLYFHSAPEGKKIEMIRHNSNVCFEVDIGHELVEAEKACDWTVRYRSVIGFGKAFLAEDPEEKRRALDIIVGHYSDTSYEYSNAALSRVAIIKVEIESMTGKQSGY